MQERSLQLQPGREHFIDLKVLDTNIKMITLVIMVMTYGHRSYYIAIVCSKINILIIFWLVSPGNSCILQRHPGHRARGYFFQIRFDQEPEMISSMIFEIYPPSEGPRLLFH